MIGYIDSCSLCVTSNNSHNIGTDLLFTSTKLIFIHVSIDSIWGGNLLAIPHHQNKYECDEEGEGIIGSSNVAIL